MVNKVAVLIACHAGVPFWLYLFAIEYETPTT
jgi:hypothetical protein